jgi:hypothetical protein
MNTYADKTQENKSQSFANAFSQKQNVGRSTFQFEDNRSEAVAQLKLREMVNNSPQVSQLRDFQDITNNDAQVNNAISRQIAYSKPPAAGAAGLRSVGPREAIVQRRRVADDRMLQDDFDRTLAHTGRRGLTLLSVLTDIANDFGVAVPYGANEAGLIALLDAQAVLDAEDVAFLRHRAQPYERSEAHAVQQDNQRQAALGVTATGARDAHRNSLRPTAIANLTRKERRQLDQGIGGEIGAAIEAKIQTYQNIHQVAGIHAIDAQLALDQAASTAAMTADFDAKKLQYDNYLVQTNNHPLSFPVLDFTNNHFQTAQNIIAAITANPALTVLVTDPASSRQLWARFINRFSGATGAVIVARIRVAGVVQYDAATSGFDLLAALHAQGGITDRKLRQIGADMAHFVAYAANGGTRMALAALLVNHHVADLRQVFVAMPNAMIPVEEKPAEFTLLWPHVIDYAALIAGIGLAARIPLPRLRVRALITHLPVNSNAIAIRGAIGANSMAEFNKLNQFGRWIRAIDQLIATEGFTIVVGANNNLGSGTIEKVCTVRNAVGQNLDTFVIHYHPGASGPTVYDPNASPRHIKPVRGNRDTLRLYWNEIPGNVLNTPLPFNA